MRPYNREAAVGQAYARRLLDRLDRDDVAGGGDGAMVRWPPSYVFHVDVVASGDKERVLVATDACLVLGKRLTSSSSGMSCFFFFPPQHFF